MSNALTTNLGIIIFDDTVIGPTGPAGSGGPTGPAGSGGPTGPTGADGSSDYVVTASQSTASGTSVTFSSIPSGTKEIFVNFMGVSVDNAAANVVVTIGDSGGEETSGYISTSCGADGGPAMSSDTASFLVANIESAANDLLTGVMHLRLANSSANTWVASGAVRATSSLLFIFAGSKSLSAELDRVLVKATSNNFDAGSVSITYN